MVLIVLSKGEIAISKMAAVLDYILESFSGGRVKKLRGFHTQSFDTISQLVTEAMRKWLNTRWQSAVIFVNGPEPNSGRHN